jgi:hypothetical protein
MAEARRKVIGLGLSKTGTKSLQQALVSIGYSNHTWSPALFERWHGGDIAAVLAAADAHDCVEDWPFLAVYRGLMDHYGASARYVLTLRQSPEIWLDSVIAHADRTPEHNEHRRMAFGYDHPKGHEPEYLAFYEAHNSGVRTAIEEHGLGHCFVELCWENGDGWARLCSLIEQVPPKRPFPHSNRRPA